MTQVSPEPLTKRVERGAERGGHVTFLASSGRHTRVSWAELHDDARGVAGDLVARGVGPGDHVALLGPTSRALVTALQGVWLAGAAVVMLPLPLRLGSVEQFVTQTRARLRNADVRMCLVDPELAAFLELEAGDPPLVLLSELGSRGGRSGRSFEVAEVDPASLAIVQFTSGSTADPKGVMIPHAQLSTHVDSIVTAARVDGESDRVVSWLPLYHDMGLVGFLVIPMVLGAELALAAPQDFMASPSRWMEWMSEFRGTLSAGPNFSYAVAARGMGRQSGLDLSSWRLGFNGAEPVDPAAVEQFCLAGRPHGLDPGSVFCVYGMAEATLAISFPQPGAGMSVDTVDRRCLEHESAAMPLHEGDGRAMRVARLGRAVPGMEIRVVDPDDRRSRGDREVGEIEIRGTSITTGYYRQPEATAEMIRDGWLRTGDLGYLAEGDLVVCGRSKDVIIVAGRNVFPEDVERAAAAVPGVRAGNVIAFAVEARRGRERLVIVAETRDEDVGVVRSAVAAEVRGAVGIALEDVVLVEPGSLPKTSSGKLQRALCRSRYLGSELSPV